MKILAVDDSDVMRQMMRFTIESSGKHQCVEAIDGKDALAKLQEHHVDLIFTDLNMPNMNGIELTQALRAQDGHKYCPIIMLTTESGERQKQQGKEAGISGWLCKPFNPEKLVTLINKYDAEIASA